MFIPTPQHMHSSPQAPVFNICHYHRCLRPVPTAPSQYINAFLWPFKHYLSRNYIQPILYNEIKLKPQPIVLKKLSLSDNINCILYIVPRQYRDYADSEISPLTQQVQCSIETWREIQIVAKDLRLFSEGGLYYQNLSINEEGLKQCCTDFLPQK